jgi:hypothetical protein
VLFEALCACWRSVPGPLSYCNTIRMVSMTCLEGILLRLGLQRDDDVLLTSVSTDISLEAIAGLAG